MTVPSLTFLAFALCGAAVFNLTSSKRWQELVWLVLNLAFVWSLARSPWPLLPFAGFLVLGYIGLRVAPRHAGWIAVVAVLAAFVWLKRYSFIPSDWLLPPVYLTLGLSYVFFRVMHLVIDSRQGAPSRIGVVRYLNFTLNFPAFTSGPIQRIEDYEANSNLPLDILAIGAAAWRMVLGAFKVMILSAGLLSWQSGLLKSFTGALPLPQRADDGGLIVILYALFLYANFSGYTDFVIGVARLYRLKLPENFDQPFAAGNFIEFWNRWHISLSQWLRSYVFNPLLIGWMRRYPAARRKQYPAIAALFVTFFLVGAWHGQTSEFLFFGLLQGGGVAGNRLYQVGMARRLTAQAYARLTENGLYRAIARGLTFTWFAFTLLWFWASWQEIGALADGLGPAGAVLAAIGSVAGASLVLSLPDLLGGSRGSVVAVLQSRYTRTAFASAMVLAITVAGLVLRLSSPEIVYKSF